MSTDEENKIEVIDPTDPRYKDDEHFHQNRYDDNKSNHQVYTYGCTHGMWMFYWLLYTNAHFSYNHNVHLLVILNGI